MGDRCGKSGGTGIGAGHECRCNRRPHDDPDHGCECGAMWRDGDMRDYPAQANPGAEPEPLVFGDAPGDSLAMPDGRKGLLLDELHVTHWLGDDGEHSIFVSAVDSQGERLPLITALGLVTFAHASILADSPMFTTPPHPDDE